MPWILISIALMFAVVVLPWLVGVYLPDESSHDHEFPCVLPANEAFVRAESIALEGGWCGFDGAVRVLTSNPNNLLEFRADEPRAPRYVLLRVEISGREGGSTLHLTRQAVILAGSWRTPYLRVFERFGGIGKGALAGAFEMLASNSASAMSKPTS